MGARSLEAAKEFAATHGILRAYGSYKEVATDSEVDVIYVGGVNTTHLPISITALENGKPVLCETPLTINVRDTELLLTTAHEKGLFLMEAAWSRYFPAMVELRQMIAEDSIGEVKYVNVIFSYRRQSQLSGRQVDPMQAWRRCIVEQWFLCGQLL